MRNLLIFIALVLAIVLPAAAQHSHGYAFIAPGSSTGRATTLHAGGGFEVMAFRDIVGVGAEAGYLFPGKQPGDGFGVISPNAYVHFPLDRTKTVDPYFTLGYSMLFRSDTRNAFNYGGGVNWWFRPRTGLKVEIRDHTFNSVHFWGIRFGVNFR